MRQTSENILFSNSGSTQPAAGNEHLLSCLDAQCQLEFPNHDTRYEHYVASHPYSRLSSTAKKPLKCRLCQKAFRLDYHLKIHVKYKHQPISRDPTVTQEDQEALILQSHAPTTDKKRSEAQKEDENIQGHRTKRQDEDTKEQFYRPPSLRSGFLENKPIQYLKRKDSQTIAPLTKKARKGSIPEPHATMPAASGVTEEGYSTDVGLDQTLSLSRAPDGYGKLRDRDARDRRKGEKGGWMMFYTWMEGDGETSHFKVGIGDESSRKRRSRGGLSAFTA